MASSTRSSRRATAALVSSNSTQPDTSVLSNLDCLILAQAVYELGANSWSAVAKLLSKHPLLSRPKTFFTAQSCHVMYNHLMTEAELDCTEANNAIHAPVNLRLAQQHYRARVLELRDLIAAEEEKFKRLAAEIDDIRSGVWDDKIAAKITGATQPVETSAAELSSVREKTLDVVIPEAVDEIFGSDLSGVTDSGSPQPRAIDASVMVKNSTPRPGLVSRVDTKEPADVDLNERSSPNDLNLEADAASESQGLPPHMITSESQSTAKSEVQRLDVTKAPATLPLVSNHLLHKQTDLAEAVPELGALNRVAEGQGSREVPEDEGGSSGDEPLHTTRKTVRTRRSSVTSMALSRKQSRELRKSPRDASVSQQHRTQGIELTLSQDDRDASTMEIDDQGKADTPLIEDDQAASPPTHEVALLRRRESKRKASFIEVMESRDKKRLREESEPVDDDEPGPTRRRRERQAPTGDYVALKRFQHVIGMLHSQISQHRNGNIFHNPIKNSEAPDYHEIVKRPMDLKTIKTRIKDGIITNSLEYQRDVYLMFANALMYNRPGSDIYNMAEDMMLESEGYIHTFRQTEGLVRGTHRV